MIDDINQVNEQGQTALIRAALDPNGEEAGLALLQAGADPGKVDEDGDSALQLACKNGHKALVTALLERGVDIEQNGSMGWTPLMLAASSPNGEEVALMLLKAGADPHKVDQDGDSALHWAAYAGHKALISTLLEQGVDPNRDGHYGRTPLITAARSPDGEEVALMVLEAGADPKKVDHKNDSALHLACSSKHTALITALLERGVDFEQANSAGMTPLMIAAYSSGGEEVALELLKAGADPSRVDEDGESALHWACRKARKALVTDLIERGVDIDLADRKGRTPLMVAAYLQNGEEVALMLLEAGANLSQVDENGESALHWACRWGRKALVADLIERGADVDLAARRGVTPLMALMTTMTAHSRRGEEVALMLLEAGSDPGKVNEDGDSALYYACCYGHKALVTELIKRGVDVDLATHRGVTPLMATAFSPNGEEVALELLKAGTDPSRVDEDGESALHWACRKARKALVTELIERGVDVNLATRRGVTPLIAAANSPFGEEIALTLLEAGADPDKVDEDGYSTLHYACGLGHKALVTELIKRGVHVDLADHKGITPLMATAFSPNGEEAALVLLKAGADPGKVDEDGESALHYVCREARKALVTELIERGVDVNLATRRGVTPLIAAANSPFGEEIVLTLLEAGADPDKVDEDGYSTLHHACGLGHKALMTDLIKRGVHVDLADHKGITPLMVAHSEKMALELLEAGADPGKVDEDGYSTLHHACGLGHKALMTDLIKRGVDINQGDSYGRTPLMIAADSSVGEEVALELLEAGADPDKVDEDGESALHYACRRGRKALVTDLIERGVDVDLATRRGATPLMVAMVHCDGAEVALELLKAGADPSKVDEDGDSALHHACRWGHKALVTELIKRGIDINQINNQKITPLMFAARSQWGEEAALELLKAGADPSQVNEDGESALHYACRWGHKALVTELIERGVDINQINSQKMTPFMFAANSLSGEEVPLALLKAGADPSRVNEDGESALHYACDSGHKALVAELIKRGVNVDLANGTGMTPLTVAANSPCGEEAALELLKAGADPTKTDNEGRSAAYFAEKQGHIELLQKLGRKGPQSTSHD